MDAKKNSSRNAGIKPRHSEEVFSTPKEVYLSRMQQKEKELENGKKNNSEAKPVLVEENPYV